MPTPLRLTRRQTVAFSDDALRKLRRFASEQGLTQDQALSFLLENHDGITDAGGLMHRMKQFKTRLEGPPQ